jgi:CheY-like chemotaxis protein
MCQILLIENHPNQRMLYEEELAEEGYHDIVTASSGPEGLELFQRHHPALIILDILLPGMDGIEVMKQMLALDSDVAIIVHSAYSTPCDVFISWYAKAYVVKSGDLQELKRQVKQVL